MSEEKNRKVALICAKGGLDDIYPSLILANAARQSGIDAMVFFTFYGLDAITDGKIDNLHVNMVGNATSPMPTMVAGLPGMTNLAAIMMKKRMKELDRPDARERIKILHESGVDIYACELAMKMFGRTEKDLIPEVKAVITAGDFYDLSEGAQIIFT